MGPFTVVLKYYLVSQIFTTTSAREPVTSSLVEKMTVNSAQSIDSSPTSTITSTKSQNRKQRDIVSDTREFSTPLLVTSISKPLPTLINKSLETFDTSPDCRTTMDSLSSSPDSSRYNELLNACRDNLYKYLTSLNSPSKDTILSELSIENVQVIDSVSMVAPCDVEPMLYKTSSHDRSELDLNSSHSTDNLLVLQKKCESLLKNPFISNELPPLSAPEYSDYSESLLFSRSLQVNNDNVLPDNKYFDTSLLSNVSPITSNKECISFDFLEEKKQNSVENVFPRTIDSQKILPLNTYSDLSPLLSTYPLNFESTSLPIVVTPVDMSIQRQNFISPLAVNRNTVSDHFLFQTDTPTINTPKSLRSISQLNPIPDECNSFNYHQTSQLLLENSFNPDISSQIPQHYFTLSKTKNSDPCLSTACHVKPKPYLSDINIMVPALLNCGANTDEETSKCLPQSISERQCLGSITSSVMSLVDKPPLVETFSTITTMRPVFFSTLNLPAECSAESISPSEYQFCLPNTPKISYKSDVHVPESDIENIKHKISPKTNPRDYIISMCNAISTESLELTSNKGSRNYVKNLDIFQYHSNPIRRNNPFTFESDIDATSNPINTVISNSFYNTPSNKEKLSTLDGCIIPTSPSIELVPPKPKITQNSLTFGNLLSSQTLLDSDTSLSFDTNTCRPTNKDISDSAIIQDSVLMNSDRNKMVISNVGKDISSVAPLVLEISAKAVSLPPSSESMCHASVPSLIDTDILCTKDYVLLHKPSLPCVSCMNITPPSSITAATSKMLSSINDIASKVAKKVVSSLSSYTEINSSSSASIDKFPLPPSSKLKTVMLKANDSYNGPPYVNSNAKLTNLACPSSLSSKSLPPTQIDNYLVPHLKPINSQSPVLPTHTLSSSPWMTSLAHSADKSNKLNNLMLLSKLLEEDDICIDQNSMETILSLI